MAKKMSQWVDEKTSFDVLILRLNTGEDVICNITKRDYDNYVLHIECPLSVTIINSDDSKQIVLSKWLPTEVIESNSCMLKLRDVVTSLKPKMSMKIRYMEIYSALKDTTKDYEVSNMFSEELSVN